MIINPLFDEVLLLLFRDFYQDKELTELLFVAENKEIYDIQSLTKSLTGTVELVLTDRPPVYRIQLGDQLKLVAASGGLRENNDQLEVPVVIDDHGLYDQTVHQFLASLLTALGKNQPVHTIRLINQERIELEVSGFPTAIVELRQDPQQTASRLTTVLAELRPASIDVALVELDLRFELPVLRTYRTQELIDSQE